MSKLWWVATLIMTMAMSAGSAVAQTEDVEYYEAPEITWSSNAKSAHPPTRLKFKALGKQFDLQLADHGNLLSSLNKAKAEAAKLDSWHARGAMIDQPNSWVRISRVGEDYFGAIWDGTTLFLVDAGWAIGVPDASVVVYDVSSLRRPGFTDVILPSPTAGAERVIENLSPRSRAKAPNKRLNVAIVTDAEFLEQNPSTPVAAAMARMNIVDGIFSEQVGVQLYVSNVEVLDDNGVMTSTAHSDLLDQFVDYYRASSMTQPGLAHLFSGKNFDGSVIGVAYLGVLCSRNFGFGISETRRGGTSGALTVAHEMGHNFDAPHDNADECSGDSTRGIMNSSLNGSSEFSQCSLGFMAAEVSNASCLLEITDDIFLGTFE